MSSAQDIPIGASERERIASLWREAPPLDADRVLELAERQLSTLAERQRTAPDAMPHTRAPRIRTTVRGMWIAWTAIQATLDAAWRWVRNPRHVAGRWWRRARLLRGRYTFGPSKLLTIAALCGLGFLTYDVFRHATAPSAEARDKAIAAVLAALFTGTTVALLRSVWDDLVRLPLVAARIRWRIRRHPECVRRPDIASRAALSEDERLPLEIVPRTDLYDDLLPGVLTRRHKDVQIVVGDPGSGKTTALISVARELARAGILPVLVPMRASGDADLVQLAHTRLIEQVESYLPADRAELLWRWLCKRQRVAVLTDDLDRVSPDGERGFMLRKALADAELRDLPIIVTARPAGVPAGIAASAIELGSLDEDDAIDAVIKGVRRSPGHGRSTRIPREPIARWVSQGQLTEVPFYLELLARLAAAGPLPAVTEPIVWRNARSAGWYRILPDGTAELNPWCVRLELLDHFRRGVIAGRVGRWLGIETRERRGALRALEGAALGTLRAMALSAAAKALPHDQRADAEPERTEIVEFIDTDDRSAKLAAELRSKEGAERQLRHRFSAQEIVETAERLQILDRNAEHRLQFRHRIMQAYLAGRCLARIEYDRRRPGEDDSRAAGLTEGWWHDLLDPRHPEKLTTQMAMTFAAIYATAKAREIKAALESDPSSAGSRSDIGAWRQIGVDLVEALVGRARTSLQRSPAETDGQQQPASGMVVTLANEQERSASLLSVRLPGDGRVDRRSRSPRDIDPMHARDPEARRDPDDALIKLTAAADIARAIELPDDGDGRVTTAHILREVDHAAFVTRWTKLSAIRAIAALRTPARWQHVWSYACDVDYLVREAASVVLEENAHEAYQELADEIDALIMRAAARTALGLQLDTTPRDAAAGDAIGWSDENRLHLKALGTVLPAIVSGLREDPSTHAPEAWQGRDGYGTDQARFDALVRRARTALERLVALAYEGDHHDLEAAVAKGFRADALRHLERRGTAGDGAPDGSHTGPGWVATHARLVSTVGLPQTQFWFAQLVLAQALALYAIAGANRRFALDNLGRFLHRGGDARHPFTQRAARLARKALLRELAGSRRWRAFVWEDEVQGVGRQRLALTTTAAQLLADITVLLDLNEGAQEDRKEPFAHMRELPYCLHRSRDRSEIVAKGCPPECGWNFCPYKQPPPDEPNEHRGVSRAFCRQQRRIAWHRLRWQRRISRRRLRRFWQEMERRART